MEHINQLNKFSLTLIILWTLLTKVVSVRQKVHVPYTFAFYEIVTNGNNFLMLSRSFFHLSCHLKRCDTVYYKLRQVLQSAMNLLQIATGITKCDDYYKLRQYIFPLVADKSGVNPEPNLLIMQSSWLCLGSHLPVR